MVVKYCMRDPDHIFFKVSYALIIVFLMIVSAEGVRRVVVYLPAKKIKHFHHHHHHMVMMDPETKMMLPFTQVIQPQPLLQAEHPEAEHLVHPHVYKPSPPAAQNRDFDFQPPTLQLSRLLAHRPRNLYQPYVIPELSSLIRGRPRKFNFEPIATAPARETNLKETQGI